VLKAISNEEKKVQEKVNANKTKTNRKKTKKIQIKKIKKHQKNLVPTNSEWITC
jgi:hypothetical protein